jgi:hypothetical protein
MDNVINWLQGVLDRSVGPGSLQIKRVQLWDLYSVLPIYNDSNLSGVTFDLFNFKPNDQISGPGFTTASPAYKASKADTNNDSPGNIPFDMFIHGMSLDFLNRQYTSGTPGGANDMQAWPFAKAALLSDTYAALTLNDNEVDRLTFLEAPAAAGVDGFAAMGTTAALATGASMAAVNNGAPLATNYRSYANEGPFFCKQNSTLKLQCQFGNSVVAASQVYKPANTGAPAIFAKAVLRGFRIWWAQ